MPPLVMNDWMEVYEIPNTDPAIDTRSAAAIKAARAEYKLVIWAQVIPRQPTLQVIR